jgi:hypothetical protein
MNALIEHTNCPFELTDDGKLVPKGDIHPSAWATFHKDLIHFNKYSKGLINQSRQYGIQNYGLQYVAETEVQLELELGFAPKDKPAPLNPADKSKAIVTIEGISQSFALWHRKMASEVETWEADRLSRALELLEPMEQQAQAIRARLNDLRV